MNRKSAAVRESASAIWLISAAMLYFVAYRKVCTYGIIGCILLYLYFSLKSEESGRIRKIRVGLSFAVLTVCAAYLFFPKRILLLILCLLALAAGVFEDVLSLHDMRFVWKKTYRSLQLDYVLRVIKIVILTGLMFALTAVEINPAVFVSRMQEYGENTFDYPQTSETEFQNSGIKTSDIVYGSEYPNSTFDLIMPAEGNCVGLAVWIHGGSYLEGDKDEEDGSIQIFNNCLKEGYAIASMNHAFAPEYVYPVPLKQLDQLLMYIQSDDRLSSLAEKTVLLATGSGATTAIQYIAASISDEYSSKISWKPQADTSHIKAMCLTSALYQPQYGGQTSLVLSDYASFQQYRLFYGSEDLVANRTAINADVLPYITEDFPLMIIAEGNSGTYSIQAEKMADIAEEKGILFAKVLFDSIYGNKNLVYMSFDVGFGSQSSAVRSNLLDLLRYLNKN